MEYYPSYYPYVSEMKIQRSRGFSQGSLEEIIEEQQINGMNYNLSLFNPQKEMQIDEEEKLAVPEELYYSPPPPEKNKKRERLLSFSEGKKKGEMKDFQVKYKTEVRNIKVEI